jgi:TM2 domain-containing membrane protein YozV
MRRPNRRVAVALTVIPGLGQLYNGQPRKALFYVIGTVFTIGPAVVLLITGERIGHSLLESHIGGLFLLVAVVSVLLFIALFVLGLFAWASAGIDAWRSAEEISKGDAGEAGRRRFFRL